MMNFDINKVLSDMIVAINDSVKDSAADIKEYAEQILKNEKESLEELAVARISGDIDDLVFNRELGREKRWFRQNCSHCKSGLGLWPKKQ